MVIRMHQVAKIDFFYPDDEKVHEVNIFMISEYVGEPTETEEMSPAWFGLDDVPYSEMWPNDIFWIPRVLMGEKLRGWFKFTNDGSITDYYLENI